ncbi:MULTISPECIES: hypothetical protein [Crocosphaera]|uniref:Uncharacterized protein n=1 Tax=Crocosphaera watsonii WH 0003 TaxID=423471 RepID=G5J027_CROWT|nr:MULTISPECIES: hypothetical protein [Crocosphaera]EHJ14461.1 hypothetical protein CWATWH0003_0864 [Crocosphaera watsonii WH 0003]MCH2243493.1 hypothetical protein [Crocosphaera sp.]
MLIKIDVSVVQSFENSNSWPDDLIIALENLALARREGKHSIIADLNTLKIIAKCSDLSKNAKISYKKILNDRPKFKAYLSHVSRYIEIIHPCNVNKIDSNSGKDIIKLPYTFFNDSETIQKSILLCENLQDTEFYKIIAETFCKWKRLNIKPKFEPSLGGGNTISTVYENIQNKKKRLCLCIVDSDKLSPNSSLGSTARNIKQKDDNTSVTTLLYILPVRELENLIPLSILSELMSKNGDRENPFKQLEKIEESSVKEIRNFLDIKEGTRLKKIVNEPSSVKDFWKDKLDKLPNYSNDIDEWCYENWSCCDPDPKKKSCKCKISLGFGQKILENTITYLNTQSSFTIPSMVEPAFLTNSAIAKLQTIM